MEDLGKRNLKVNPGTAGCEGSVCSEYHCVVPCENDRWKWPIFLTESSKGEGEPGAPVGAEEGSVTLKLSSVSAGCHGWWEPGNTPGHTQCIWHFPRSDATGWGRPPSC